MIVIAASVSMTAVAGMILVAVRAIRIHQWRRRLAKLPIRPLWQG